MKIYEIDWIDGNKYKDKFGKVWTVSQKELRRKNERTNKNEYITDGRFALGTLLELEFEKIESEDV